MRKSTDLTVINPLRTSEVSDFNIRKNLLTSFTPYLKYPAYPPPTRSHVALLRSWAKLSAYPIRTTLWAQDIPIGWVLFYIKQKPVAQHIAEDLISFLVHYTDGVEWGVNTLVEFFHSFFIPTNVGLEQSFAKTIYVYKQMVNPLLFRTGFTWREVDFSKMENCPS